MPEEKYRHKVVNELNSLIKTHRWKGKFEKAIKNAQSHGVERIKDIRNLNDYMRWIDDLLHWAPRQKGDTRLVYQKIVEFYFFLDQDPVKKLQNPITPGKRVGGKYRPPRLTPCPDGSRSLPSPGATTSTHRPRPRRSSPSRTTRSSTGTHTWRRPAGTSPSTSSSPAT